MSAEILDIPIRFGNHGKSSSSLRTNYQAQLELLKHESTVLPFNDVIILCVVTLIVVGLVCRMTQCGKYVSRLVLKK